jgi:hypothetical protein
MDGRVEPAHDGERGEGSTFSFSGVIPDGVHAWTESHVAICTPDGIRASSEARFYFDGGYPLNKGCGNKLQTARSDVQRRISGVHWGSLLRGNRHKKTARENREPFAYTYVDITQVVSAETRFKRY